MILTTERSVVKEKLRDRDFSRLTRESSTATFMGVSGECAIKGSKSSHPCHCCSHVGSSGASVQQSQQQQQQQQQQSYEPYHHHHHQHHHHHHHHHHHGKHAPPSASPQHNNSGDNNILAPLRSKMKVLKKLKRKMGLGEPHLHHFLIVSDTFRSLLGRSCD
ncbi:hypothetical protein ALC53_09656 [Atta colombica]|uniref:Uncharacterized protein n=1 Tax=Atta colombica TaxID=520822 RepID=A0A151I1C5_9HYME|nr:hypothetical protein ALC53_09656 [Atta colombica]